MPDTKITALTAIGANPIIPATFPIPMVDLTDTSMAASGTTKKVTVNQILGAGGTATLASATITGDLTAARLNVTGATIPANGVYLASANNLTFAFNSTLGMSLNAGGLLVNNTTGFNTVANIKLKLGGRFLSGISGVGAYSFGTADAGGFVINDAGDGSTENRLLTLNSTGLGVGGSPANFANYTTIHAIGKTTTAGGVFQTSTSNNSTAARFACSSTAVDLFVETSHPIDFYTNATKRMTLDASGNLLVARTGAGLDNTSGVTIGQASIGMQSEGNATQIVVNRTTSDGTIVDLRRNNSSVGNISVTTSGATFNSTSDYRLKESVAPLNGGLARVNALKPSVYKWKSNGSDGEGFLAHELAEVVPAAVNGEKDAVNDDGSIKAQSIDMSRVVPILVAAIQELTAEVNALKNA